MLTHTGWESEEAQAKFQKTPVFEEMMGKLKSIMTGPPTAYFIEFKPYAPPAVIDSRFVQCSKYTGLQSIALY
jgi:heme-degrading monooxygenase HmoA